MLLSRANELLVGGVGHKQTVADRSPYDLLSTPIPKSKVPQPGVYARLPMGKGVEQCQPTAMQLFAQP